MKNKCKTKYNISDENETKYISNSNEIYKIYLQPRNFSIIDIIII